VESFSYRRRRGTSFVSRVLIIFFAFSGDQSNCRVRHEYLLPANHGGRCSALGPPLLPCWELLSVSTCHFQNARSLACLPFAAGSLISALAIELAYESAQSLHHQGFNAHAAWAFISAGFAAGAGHLLFDIAPFLEEEGSGGALRHPSSANMPLRANRQTPTSEIKLLATCGPDAATCQPNRSSKSCRASTPAI